MTHALTDMSISIEGLLLPPATTPPASLRRPAVEQGVEPDLSDHVPFPDSVTAVTGLENPESLTGYDDIDIPDLLTGAARGARYESAYARHSMLALSNPRFGWRDKFTLWRASVSGNARTERLWLERFEAAIADNTGTSAALATSSATAALRLALMVLGVRAGDDVLIPILAPRAVAAPVLALRANPVLIDVDPDSGTIDPELVRQRLRAGADAGRLPKAVVAVDLYGHLCNYRQLGAVCAEYGVPLIEDASDALGADLKGTRAGSAATLGIISFGANKVVSTANGGALVSKDGMLIAKARRLAQSTVTDGKSGNRSSVLMSPVLASLGFMQLQRLHDLVRQRRKVARRYARKLHSMSGITLVPEVSWGRSSRWLSVVAIDELRFGMSATALHDALRVRLIETRLAWPALHTTPEFNTAEVLGGEGATSISASWLCLPSGSDIGWSEQRRVLKAIRSVRARARG